MNAALKIAAAFVGVSFVMVGLTWWSAPGFAGGQMGMELLSGAGLSTQIADLAAFFITLGVVILIGLASGNQAWLYSGVMLLALALVGRVISWGFHGADLTIGMIATEAAVIIILLLVVRTLPQSKV